VLGDQPQWSERRPTGADRPGRRGARAYHIAAASALATRSVCSCATKWTSSTTPGAVPPTRSSRLEPIDHAGHSDRAPATVCAGSRSTDSLRIGLKTASPEHPREVLALVAVDQRHAVAAQGELGARHVDRRGTAHPTPRT
jgi:hypothetical protein